MVTDFETVLEICKSSLKVNTFGIPEDSERKRFYGKLFLNDRHYLNIIVMAAIKLEYILISNHKGKTIAITTEKSKELVNMPVKSKIKLLAEGIIENFVSSINLEIPQLKDLITKRAIWEIIENPSKLEDFIYSINEKLGIDNNFLYQIIDKKEVDFEELEDMFTNNPSSNMLAILMIRIDIYLFTPLGYYLQLIKPFYGDVYNIMVEMEYIFSFLDEEYVYVRNLLFSIPEEFDLTLLGEEIILNGKKSKIVEKINGNYDDESFLKCFKKRQQYIEDELSDFYNDYDDDDYDHDDDYDDDDDNDDDDDYDDDDDDDNDDDDDYDGDNDYENLTSKKDKVIDLSSYRLMNSSTEMKDDLYMIKVKNFYAKTSWIMVDILGNSTLDDLHNIISSNFNLEWGHLYSFFMSGKFWDNTSEYCDPQADGRKKADKVKIGSLNLIEGSKFAYLYDYGDELKFELECKQVVQPQTGTKYPRVSKKSKRFIEEEE
mgnify:CR=1 FL=1